MYVKDFEFMKALPKLILGIESELTKHTGVFIYPASKCGTARFKVIKQFYPITRLGF